MYFNSFEYVVFLWAVYVLYWTLKEKRKLRFSMVLVASYWFYAQADWRFCFLLFASTVVDYVAGKRLHAANEAGDDRRRKAFLALSLASNLGMLGFFKYFDFFVDGFEDLFARWGQEAHLWHLSAAQGGPLDYIVPAGISFYTFQTLSYTIDIYYRRLKPCRSHLEFAVYVAFFPQLVAGPIVRARDFLPQMERPRALTRERISLGLWEILRGMAKKLVIADVLGAHLVEAVYHDASTLEQAGALGVILGTYGFTMQLFGDFAGYSDIAIGSARLLGFDLKKNFDQPFKARSLEDIWTRWHISMSFWFYFYVFAGMGGNKRGLKRTCFNLFITHLLSGLWHGAGWNFVLWGAWWGVWMVIVRLVRAFLPDGTMPRKPIFGLLGWLFTYTIVGASLVFFRANDTESVLAAIRALGDWGRPLPAAITAQPWQVWAVFALGYASCLWPDSWNQAMLGGWKRLPALAQGAACAALMLLFLGVAPPGLAPFIYFQF
jgi:D-alanyl-lipoteichoic acid acyltransferase DltB (MBOAT superfamily)